MSEFWSAAHTITEELDNAEGPEDVRTQAEELRNLGQETRDKYDGLPEGFQQGATGELLDERANACEQLADDWESEVDSWESEWPEEYDEDTHKEEYPTEEEYLDARQDAWADFQCNLDVTLDCS